MSSSSNLASSAACEYSPSRVRFNPELASPSKSNGRPRRASNPYPKVAQTKGTADRKFSFDLFWKLHTLSAVSNIIPIDAADDVEIAGATQCAIKKQPASENTATPRRSHSYIVLSCKQTEVLLKSEDPKDRRLQELVRVGVSRT